MQTAHTKNLVRDNYSKHISHVQQDDIIDKSENACG